MGSETEPLEQLLRETHLVSFGAVKTECESAALLQNIYEGDQYATDSEKISQQHSARIFGESEVLGLETRPRNSQERWAHKLGIQVLRGGFRTSLAVHFGIRMVQPRYFTSRGNATRGDTARRSG